MQRTVHRYSDPTGGGDDAYLVVPVWAEAPQKLRLTLDGGASEVFELDDQVTGEELVDIVDETVED